MGFMNMAGGVVGAVGSLQAGRAQAKQAEYNAAIQEREAVIAEQEADFEEASLRRKGERLKSTQRARYSKSGVKMNTGSPLLVMEDTAAEIERDALAIRYGGKVAAQRARSGADIERFQGKQAKRASYFGAASSLLSGGSKTYQYYRQ